MICPWKWQGIIPFPVQPMEFDLKEDCLRGGSLPSMVIDDNNGGNC